MWNFEMMEEYVVHYNSVSEQKLVKLISKLRGRRYYKQQKEEISSQFSIFQAL